MATLSLHFMRNALAYAPKTQETVVAASHPPVLRPFRSRDCGPGLATRRRLVGAVFMEHNDDWQTQNRYMQRAS